MLVVIAGGGRTGTQLARDLLDQGQEVRVIEDRQEVLAWVHQEVPTEDVFEGSPLDPEVLEIADMPRADVAAAITASDELNLAFCFLAREKYHVPRTIARVNNPRSAWLFDDTFDVDIAVNQAEILSRLIQEEMSLGDMITLLKLRRGNYSLVEEKVPPKAQAVGKPVRDLGLPEHCVIVSVIRSGDMIVPGGNTELESGDEVLALADAEGARVLSGILAGK